MPNKIYPTEHTQSKIKKIIRQWLRRTKKRKGRSWWDLGHGSPNRQWFQTGRGNWESGPLWWWWWGQKSAPPETKDQSQGHCRGPGLGHKTPFLLFPLSFSRPQPTGGSPTPTPGCPAAPQSWVRCGRPWWKGDAKDGQPFPLLSLPLSLLKFKFAVALISSFRL